MTGHLEELNKQVSGKFGDLQGQMSAMQGTMQGTMQGMQGTMQGMQGSMSAMGHLTSNWSMFGNLTCKQGVCVCVEVQLGPWFKLKRKPASNPKT